MEITYQPILDLQTGRIVKCEALCRPPESGLDLGAFVASAEMNGSLRGYTDRVLDSVFADWKRNGLAVVDLSINLTVTDLAERDIPKRVEKAAKRHRFDTKNLWFEIDDRAQAIVDPQTLETMARLASLGVRFSLDSFGDDLTQATYYEVESLNVSEIKIDGRFVRDADENMAHRQTITAVVAMARDLRVAACAKSVERQSIASLVARLGVTSGQGYYFARPTPAAMVVELVERMSVGAPLRVSR